VAAVTGALLFLLGIFVGFGFSQLWSLSTDLLEIWREEQRR
jgi:hypothetical protein